MSRICRAAFKDKRLNCHRQK